MMRFHCTSKILGQLALIPTTKMSRRITLVWFGVVRRHRVRRRVEWGGGRHHRQPPGDGAQPPHRKESARTDYTRAPEDYVGKNSRMPMPGVNVLPKILENLICRIKRKRGVAFRDVPLLRPSQKRAPG